MCRRGAKSFNAADELLSRLDVQDASAMARAIARPIPRDAPLIITKPDNPSEEAAVLSVMI